MRTFWTSTRNATIWSDAESVAVTYNVDGAVLPPPPPPEDPQETPSAASEHERVSRMERWMDRIAVLARVWSRHLDRRRLAVELQALSWLQDG
jgi:hypothetical protein